MNSSSWSKRRFHGVSRSARLAGRGEFLIVPRGVEHRPVAEEEAHVLLFEPASTLNTGNVQNERTVAHLDRI
jgi:mannose-6-phosphate isomerase-like protein (cupin superfamily)